MRPILTVITPTGDRQASFGLCEEWMKAQTIYPDQWIVVDDGIVPTKVTCGQELLRLGSPLMGEPKMRYSSQARNINRGLEKAYGDVILFVEDDDFYGPSHLETVYEHLKTYEIAGEHPAMYYNLRMRCWRNMNNQGHSSLAQTGIRQSLIPVLRLICAEGPDYIDARLWAHVKSKQMNTCLYKPEKPIVIGMKGLPGRPAVSRFHQDIDGWTPDPDHSQLIKWAGAKSVKRYREVFFGEN